MKKEDIRELGFIWDGLEMMYKIRNDGEWEYFTKREIEMIHEDVVINVDEDYSMEHPFKYRYLTGIKPLMVWCLVEYLSREAKINPEINEMLQNGKHYLALLNNEFTKEEFIESVEKLERYGLMKVEWINKDEALCKLTIKKPPYLKEANHTNSKKYMRMVYNEIGEFENKPLKDFHI